MNTAYLCKDVSFLLSNCFCRDKKRFNFDQNYRGRVKNFETNRISIALYIYLGR